MKTQKQFWSWSELYYILRGMKVFICFILSFFWGIAAAQAQQNVTKSLKKSPVILELFSSQACPACPPADAYLGVLAMQENVIALSCHVDYFGKGSGDTAQNFCTSRQSHYIKAIGRKSHYTPQLMINGHINAIGYDKADITPKLQTARDDRIQRIAIYPRASGVYNFTLPKTALKQQSDLVLAIYSKPIMVKKRGQQVLYTNVITHLIPLGTWHGSQLTRPVFPVTTPKTFGFAILAQDRKTGKMIAAGDYRL